MTLTPSQVSGATFRTVRKGYDPDEVDAFLAEVAAAIESAQQQATAMEARARAAVARLQEVTAAQPTSEPVRVDEPAGAVHVSADEAETISRTLLLAQRTADSTMAEARAEAERIAAEATAEAERTLDSTREMSARLLAEARAEARRATDQERTLVEGEVEALRARREFLVGDVDQLEQFLIDQRERLRAAARQIETMCERVPAGLGSVRPPALSADRSADTVESDDTESGDDDAGDGRGDGDDDNPDGDDTADLAPTAELVVPPEASMPFAGIEELVEALEHDDDAASLGGSDWAQPDDQGPNVDPSDAPHLPTRNSTSD